MNLPSDYGDRATAYAQRVVTGKILACEYVTLACERHLNDLNRQGTEDFPYVFNPVMADSNGQHYRPAERVCYYIEQLPHVKGEWAKAKQKISLEDWQVFIEAVVFGWVDATTGLRRFKTVYVEVPRKNAKTTIASGNGLYLLMRDDEAGAEVYSAATSAEQAKISWLIAKMMVDKSPGMQKRFGVSTYAHSIPVESEGSFFQYLSSDSKSLDGLNISGAIVDELHAHKTREVWDVIETGTGSREQPLLFAITTAGSNRSGICYEQRAYLIKLLRGQVADDSYFGIIYTIDADDDWTDPAIWGKANPNLGVSVKLDDLQRKCTKASAMPSAQNNFKTKHLNVWVNADVSWMDMNEWEACGDPDLDIEDFAGDDCIVALDLSSKTDLAARIALFERMIDNVKHYYVFGKYYLPTETVRKGLNDSYAGWAEEGLLVTTPGNVIDYGFIEQDLCDISSLYQIKEVPYDPFQATQLSTRMMAEGFPMVEMRPTVLNFSEPMKELEALVLERRLHHDGDKLLEWMVSNVVCHTDAKDNIYPRRERDENKIDGVISLIMALGRAITTGEPKRSVYEKRGVISL
mgnify:CR=1 FL=1